MSPRATAGRTPLAPAILIGTDIIEIGRVAESMAQFGERYVSRLYTREEATYCSNAGSDPAPHFAARRAGPRGELDELMANVAAYAGLRQGEGDCLLILFQGRFPALNRSQLPALIILADP